MNIKEAFFKAFAEEEKPVIENIRSVKNWAIIDYSLDNNRGSLLMKMKNNQWEEEAFCGIGITTDLLRFKGVDMSLWDKLLDPPFMEKAKPVLSAVRGELKGYLLRSLRMVSNWAVCDWTELDGEEVIGEGQALVSLAGGKAILIESSGGIFDEESLTEKGVPKNMVPQLLGHKE